MCASQIQVVVEFLDPRMPQETSVSVPNVQCQKCCNSKLKLNIHQKNVLWNSMKQRFTSAILLATWKLRSLIKPTISRCIFEFMAENNTHRVKTESSLCKPDLVSIATSNWRRMNMTFLFKRQASIKFAIVPFFH